MSHNRFLFTKSPHDNPGVGSATETPRPQQINTGLPNKATVVPNGVSLWNARKRIHDPGLVGGPSALAVRQQIRGMYRNSRK